MAAGGGKYGKAPPPEAHGILVLEAAAHIFCAVLELV